MDLNTAAVLILCHTHSQPLLLCEWSTTRRRCRRCQRPTWASSSQHATVWIYLEPINMNFVFKQIKCGFYGLGRPTTQHTVAGFALLWIILLLHKLARLGCECLFLYSPSCRVSYRFGLFFACRAIHRFAFFFGLVLSLTKCLDVCGSKVRRMSKIDKVDRHNVLHETPG